MSAGGLEKTFYFGQFQIYIKKLDSRMNLLMLEGFNNCQSQTIMFIYIPTSTHKLGYFRAKYK